MSTVSDLSDNGSGIVGGKMISLGFISWILEILKKTEVYTSSLLCMKWKYILFEAQNKSLGFGSSAKLFDLILFA